MKDLETPRAEAIVARFIDAVDRLAATMATLQFSLDAFTSLIERERDKDDDETPTDPIRVTKRAQHAIARFSDACLECGGVGRVRSETRPDYTVSCSYCRGTGEAQ